RTGLDTCGDVADVDDLVLDLGPVLEATQLRDAHVEGRLAALEPGRDRAAGAGLLALRAAAGGLALAGGDAAADPGPRGVRPVRGAEVVELHAFSSPSPAALAFGAAARPFVLAPSTSSTETRKRPWRTMPRVEGLSATSTVCPIRFRPRARTVARLRERWLILLFVSGKRTVTVIGA